jgi:hypothetical protein
MATPLLYVDPRAQALYGNAPAKKYTDKEIKDFITAPGMTPDKIYNKALETGVTADEVSNAMDGVAGYSPDKIKNWLTNERQVSFETKDPLPTQGQTVVNPEKVVADKIDVRSVDTVQGQLDSILKDTNSPLLRQAQTYGTQFANRRGLANSSIAASAGENALLNMSMPIAQQDASTNYNSNTSNVTNKLNADSLNSNLQANLIGSREDIAARKLMNSENLATNKYIADKDVAARLSMNDANLTTNKYIADNDNAVRKQMNLDSIEANKFIATMDTDTKLKMANIEAMANDSGIMGQTSNNMMELVYKIGADPNITPENKTSMINQVIAQGNKALSLLPSFEGVKDLITFGSSGGSGGETNSNGAVTTGSGTQIVTGSGNGAAQQILSPKGNPVNILNHALDPATQGAVTAYERKTKTKVDMSKVVPQQLIEDLRYGPVTMNVGQFYTGSDGQSHLRNFNAYDYQQLYKDYGVKNQGELIDKMFQPVYIPNAKFPDQIQFYMYK